MKKYSTSWAETPKVFEGLGQLRYVWIKRFIKNKKVLELGSGLGEGAYYLANNGAKQVLGVDYARKAIEQAEKRFKKTNLEFRLMNVLNIDSLKRKYDVVVAFELLEHLDKQEQVRLVRMIKGKIRQGGVIIVSTPNRLVFSRGREKSRYPFHKYELTVKDLRKLFKSEFKRVRIEGVECVNQKSVMRRKRLEKSWWHKLIEWWAGFGWVHRLMPMIPKGLKGWVAGESKLPKLRVKDYQLIDNQVEQCEDLWLEARV